MGEEKLNILVGVKGARDSENSLKSVSDILNTVAKTATNVNNVLNTFISSSAKHTQNLVNQYKTLNQEIQKYQQNLQRTSTIPQQKSLIVDSTGRPFQQPIQQPVSQSSLPRGTSWGGNRFADIQQQEQQRQQEQQQYRNRYLSTMGRVGRTVNTVGGIAQQVGQGDFSGAWQNTLQTASQSMLGNTFLAIPGAIGLIRVMRDKIITQMGSVYANAISSFSNVTGMTGEFKQTKEMLNKGVSLGYSNAEVASMAESYTRSGGVNVKDNIPSIMRVARSYGINPNEVASMQGELSRYTGNTRDVRDVISVGQAGRVPGQMMSEYTGMVMNAWKQAISQGINIRNPEKIASSFAILNKMGFQGIESQAMFGNLNQAISTAGNLGDPRQIMIMRALQAANPNKSLLELQEQSEKGMSDPANMRAVLQFQKDRGLTGDDRIRDLVAQTGISISQAKRLTAGFDRGETSIDERRSVLRQNQAAEQDRRQYQMSQHIRANRYAKNLRGEAVAVQRGEAVFVDAENRQLSNLVTMLNVMNESSGALSRGMGFLKEIMVGNSRNVQENTQALNDLNANIGAGVSRYEQPRRPSTSGRR